MGLGFLNRGRGQNLEIIENKDILIEQNSPSQTIESLDGIFEKLLDYLSEKHTNLLLSIKRKVVEKEKIVPVIENYLDTKYPYLNKNSKDYLLDKFYKFVWGYGILQPLIDDDDVSDIRIMDWDNIRGKRFGKRFATNLKFKDREDMERYIAGVAIKNQIPLSEANAMQRFSDRTSSESCRLRISITTDFLTSVDHGYLYIRKIPKIKKQLPDLIQAKMMNGAIAQYLANASYYGLSLFFGGQGATGKTTLMNACLEKYDPSRSGLIIQEAEELFCDVHPEMMFKTVVMNKGESKIEYTLRDLAINGLVEDIDMFCIGEIKGGEAYDMANAAYTGATCWGSVHCATPEEAFDKLIHYCKYVSDMSERQILRMFSYLDVIVYMKDFKCAKIIEIEGFDEESGRIKTRTIFEFQLKKVNGEIKGTFVRVNDSCDRIKNKLMYAEYRKQ